MNFTQEEVFEVLKAKFGNDQKISDRTITTQIETLLGVVADEIELADFVEKAFVPLKAMNGNMVKALADFFKDEQSKNTSQKKDVEEKKVEQTPIVATHETPELPEDVKEAVAYYKEQKKEKDIQKKRKIISDNITKGFGSGESASFNVFFETQNIDESEDVDSAVQRLTESYTKIKKTLTVDTRPLSSHINGKTFDDEFADIPVVGNIKK